MWQKIKKFFSKFLQKEEQLQIYILEHNCGCQLVEDICDWYPNNPQKQFVCLKCNCITSTDISEIIVDADDPIIITAAKNQQLFLHTKPI